MTACLIGMISLITGQAYAEDNVELSASVDRQQIYLSDTVNLRVTGNMQLDFSIGGIMNFGRSQVESPDLASLNESFEILDQQQSYNMQMINGKSTNQITWNYTLAPKASGQLEIPAITFRNAKSEPIIVEVLEGDAPRNAERPPEVFIEVEVDKDSVYVQEQILYTVRLFALDHLASGEWSKPEPQDAIVEQLGEVNKFYRMAYNQRYEVRERKFLLFPQKSGTLAIEAQEFSGIMMDTRSRRRLRVRDVSESLEVEVKAPPAEFTGDLWLPAAALELTEEWSQNPDDIKVGDSLTRTLQISALGLLGSALPPLEMQPSSNIKVYPDQAETSSGAHAMGVQSSRIENTALVAVQSGKAALPEIRIPWWDTVNDVERVAVIPARTLILQPGAMPATPAAIEAPDSIAPDRMALDQPAPDIPSEAGQATPDLPNEAMPAPKGLSQTLWIAICLVLIVGWATTTWWLIKRMPKQKDTEFVYRAVGAQALKNAIRDASPNMPFLLLEYMQNQFPALAINSLCDLAQIDSELALHAHAFEASLYGANGAKTSYDARSLLDAVERCEQQRIKADNKALPDFYPA